MNPIALDGMNITGVAPGGLLVLLFWSLFWKGFALWHAAKRDEKWWFIAFLLLNTVGILEIVYLFFIAKVPAFRSKCGLKAE